MDLWELCCFTKVPDGPQTYTLNVLWFQEKGAQIHMSEWSLSFTLTNNVGRGFILWSTPPNSGLSDSPIRWKCLLRVLSPVRRPITALDCVLLKDRSLVLTPRLCAEISSRACLWVSPRPCHHTQCWLSNQRLIFRVSWLETPKPGSGPTKFRTEPPLAISSAISLPCTHSMSTVSI
jgi:hypothetical protein